jgi:hypothetical protein
MKKKLVLVVFLSTVSVQFHSMLSQSINQKTYAEVSVKEGGKWEGRKYIGGTFKNVQNKRIPVNIFLERRLKLKKKTKLKTSQDPVNAFLNLQKLNIIPNELDYSLHDVFFPKKIYYQGNRGICHSATAGMLFSFFINIQRYRKSLELIKDPIEFVNKKKNKTNKFTKTFLILCDIIVID